MAVVLAANAYGKSQVRLTKIERHAERHDLFEWCIGVQLTGEFAAAYTRGDNRQVIATDTMKNAVYALAADAPLGSPEAFGLALGRHFLSYPQVASARIEIDVIGWQRIAIDGREHPHAFTQAGAERRTCTIAADRTAENVAAGLKDLLVLKTTDSAWRDFHRDAYRTLPDTDDRILATSVKAEWTYTEPADWNAAYAVARGTLIEAFADHKSLGAQHTLHAMGEAVLAALPAIDAIAITLPNRHRIPVNLTPFGRANTNSIFVATDEPHGLISATLRRG